MTSEVQLNHSAKQVKKQKSKNLFKCMLNNLSTKLSKKTTTMYSFSNGLFSSY